MNSFDAPTLALAERLLAACRIKGWQLVTAESCTGGLLAGALTAIAGSSDVVMGGFVTYANAAKMQWLGVPELTLARYGAVSAETAVAMALGASRTANGAFAISTTGIAGPGGGSAEKPVGLVYVGLARVQAGSPGLSHRLDLGNRDRDTVRRQTVTAALRHALDQATAPTAP